MVFQEWREKDHGIVMLRGYIGYGYMMDTYQDGFRKIWKEKNKETIPLGKFLKFDKKGYPIYQEELR